MIPAGGVQYEDGLEGGLYQGGQGGQERNQVLLQLKYEDIKGWYLNSETRDTRKTMNAIRCSTN
jgi:hypothetical protein